MQTQEDHSNPIPALNVDSLKVDLVVIQNTCSEKEGRNQFTKMSKAKERCMAYFRSLHSLLQVLSKDDLKGTRIEHGYKRAFMSLFDTALVITLEASSTLQEFTTPTRWMQTQESKVDTGKALDVDLVDTESIRTDSTVQDDTAGRTIEQTTSLLANNAELKAQIQEKVFAIAALKNDLRKLKGNSVDTKFDKTSVLGKPVLPSLRNQSVVRQPNAFKSERPQMSKQRFASQVDVNNNLSKPVTQHYLPKKTESAFAKPDHMIASSSSRNTYKNMPRFSSNDMVHNHYLDEAKKKTQERDRNSKTSVMPSARFQCTADDSKPKPRSKNQTPRSLPIPNACITKLLKEIFTRHRFSPNKTSTVYEKTSPISDLRWKPMGIIFKYVSLRWIPTGKTFDSCTGKVDSELTHGSNVDTPNIHVCKQTLDLSAGALLNGQKQQRIDLSAGALYNVKQENLRVWLLKKLISKKPLS
ncbi:hypothetical protein Tco_0108846 [Tanacetum coccineum]